MTEQDSIISISSGEDDSVDDSGIVDSTLVKYTTAYGDFIGSTMKNLDSVWEEENTEDLAAMDLFKASVKEEPMMDTPQRKPRHRLILPAFTPQRLNKDTVTYFSPEQRDVPEIVIIPPSVDRKRGIYYEKTPSRTTKILVSTPRNSRTFKALIRPSQSHGGTPKFNKQRRESTGVFIFPNAKNFKNYDKDAGDTTPLVPVESAQNVPRKVDKRSTSPLLSPRNRTIGKKSPNSTQKYSAEKMRAIMSDLEFNGGSLAGKREAGRGGGTSVPRSQVKVKSDRKTSGSPLLLLNSSKITPKAFHSTASTICTPTRHVGKGKRPPCDAKADTSPGLSIRGVRLNRHFQLLMQYRNNCTESN